MLQFYRGWWCPKEQAFFRRLMRLQDEAEVAYTIRADKGALVALRRPDARFALAPAYKDAFTNAQLPLVLFRRDASNGQIVGLSLGLGRVRDLRFRKTDDKAVGQVNR